MIYQFLLHLFKTHVFVTYILSDTEKMEILKRAGFYCPNTFGQEMFFFVISFLSKDATKYALNTTNALF